MALKFKGCTIWLGTIPFQAAASESKAVTKIYTLCAFAWRSPPKKWNGKKIQKQNNNNSNSDVNTDWNLWGARCVSARLEWVAK